MKTQEFLNTQTNAMRALLVGLPANFDSHQFIERFCTAFQSDYDRLLDRFTINRHRKVNAQIALWLLRNRDLLNLNKNGKVISQNILGNFTPNEQWAKLN